jgi:NTE family protein
MKPIGINLYGGGARGSYQAGVLMALGQILKKRNLLGRRNPFKIWSGTSAGAINAAFCTSQATDLEAAGEQLAQLWKEITPEQIYRTDLLSLSKNSAKWIRDLTFGSLFQKKLAQYLLNATPLISLLNKKINFQQIQENIDQQIISSLSCTAYCFNTSKTVSFVQGNSPSWKRSNRHSVHETIGASHILASCSIPMLFPLTKIKNQYFADGGFRSTAPSSSVIHQGAQKILMVGVRYPLANDSEITFSAEPGVAKVAGSMLNALFFDNIDLDLERLELVNEIIQSVSQSIQTKRSDYSTLDYQLIRPSEDIAKIAENCSQQGFPKVLQFLIDGLGSRQDTADLSSYLLFHPTFTKPLVDLGYKDTMKKREELEDWICKDSGLDN